MGKRMIMDENIQQIEEVKRLFDFWGKVIITYENGEKKELTPEQAYNLLIQSTGEENFLKIDGFSRG